MLIEFSVSNFRSINKKCTLSMLAQGIFDNPESNYAKIDKLKILKSAVIYGANSSGKSNMIKALMEMKYQICSSVRLNSDDALDYDPFLLSIKSNRPSFFEIVFFIEEKKYRYGFELDSNKIYKEWLFSSILNKKKENVLFIRNEDGIGVDSKYFDEGIDKEEITNENRLFLSLCAQLGGSKSKKILSWFRKNFRVLSGTATDRYDNFSAKLIHENKDEGMRAKVFFQDLQLGFKSIETKVEELSLFDTAEFQEILSDSWRRKIEGSLKGEKIIKLESQHDIYDEAGNSVEKINFDFKEKESEGTKKLIQLSGPIFDALKNGNVLIIDELDAKMHPLISIYIIKLFNCPETNPSNAQLIFTTHDTNLLSANIFRRDQIWFTEKDSLEQTNLYNMMEIKLPDGSKPRNDANYEKNYISGRYGAIPYFVNR